MNGNNPANPTMIEFESDRGLTKREIMAMHAMQAMLSNQGMFDVFGAGEAISREAVIVADALLKELNK